MKRIFVFFFILIVALFFSEIAFAAADITGIWDISETGIWGEYDGSDGPAAIYYQDANNISFLVSQTVLVVPSGAIIEEDNYELRGYFWDPNAIRDWNQPGAPWIGAQISITLFLSFDSETAASGVVEIHGTGNGFEFFGGSNIALEKRDAQSTDNFSGNWIYSVTAHESAPLDCAGDPNLPQTGNIYIEQKGNVALLYINDSGMAMGALVNNEAAFYPKGVIGVSVSIAFDSESSGSGVLRWSWDSPPCEGEYSFGMTNLLAISASKQTGGRRHSCFIAIL